jgi:hypothetical protein
MLRTILSILAVAFTFGSLHAQAPAKQPLDHSAYDIWKTLGNQALSRDGAWLTYRLTLQDGDAELLLHGLQSGAEHRLPRGERATFTADARFVAFIIKPELALVRQAKREKKSRDEQPKDSLGIVDLTSGDVSRFARVKSFQLPGEQSTWLAYLIEPTPPAEDSSESADTAATPRPDRGRAASGDVLVLRNLTTGDERRFENVSTYRFAEDGSFLAFVAEQDDEHHVLILDPAVDEAVEIATGDESYKSLVVADGGEQLGFLGEENGETDPDDEPAGEEGDQDDEVDDEATTWVVYHWRAGWDAARPVAGTGTPGIADDWAVSENGSLSFSRDGRRLFFGTAPIAEPAPDDSLIDEERITVDIWNWKDPYLQPMQKLQVQRERRRSYQAVVDLRDGRVVQLATADMPSVSVGVHGNADLAVGTSDLPYRQLVSWDSPGYQDVYLVDVQTGERELVLEKTQARVSLSPEAQYLTWYDNVEEDWFARDVESGRTVNLTRSIAYPLYDEQHDTPSPPRAYGSAGWTDGDRLFLINDLYDIWATDPTGRSAARSITEGRGRAENITLRFVELDADADAIDPREPMLLSAFHRATKDAGFYRDRVEGNDEPQRLLFMDRRFGRPQKAEEADVLLFTRSSVEEFPNVWVSDLDFGGARQVSDANPQQADYRWVTVELVEWLSADGIPLQGLLYKPEGFDPSRQYPLMVNFYERDSDNLHAHHPPIPHRSVVRPTFYGSRGYVVFMPDVVYQTGYPGESALDAVVPGVLSLIEQGFIDEERIGVQGHSWGGYQIAFLVTKTNLFRAAAAGAVVSNMTSAYGGIRWGSGMSRMFQYERTQSRIGATLWEAPMRYIENSPVFWADKVETPLLMMHNDADGAVPWYQGIEYFVALRRLGKPVWMVDYNDEPHWPVTFHEKRDWNIRMQQFFDHFLKDAPAPVWLEQGIPAMQKGRTLGLELIERE